MKYIIGLLLGVLLCLWVGPAEAWRVKVHEKKTELGHTVETDLPDVVAPFANPKDCVKMKRKSSNLVVQNLAAQERMQAYPSGNFTIRYKQYRKGESTEFTTGLITLICIP